MLFCYRIIKLLFVNVFWNYYIVFSDIPTLVDIHEHIGRLARMSILDTEVDGSNPGSSMLFP